MRKNWELTTEAFEQLLAWLNPGDQAEAREAAGRKYEEIRRKLIRIFAARGCIQAEELADETINRVTKKLPELIGNYNGDPTRFFYGVANKVFLEYTKSPPTIFPPPPPEPAEVLEKRCHCLDLCLGHLKPEDREMITAYYQEQRIEKVEMRKRLAQQFMISDNALKIRAFRLRQRLYECVTDCLDSNLMK
jgi:DNA-directed RNA polymerase specialized sigma24 family protein